ncbi:uncharacterized protein Z520_11094 [Fonsecaea multimorphosa CBS 102226]|uniref:Alpha/beta hydrolase fold-3 domain-containing protein n=1 Tax=Fonsecaea multimorphosa CBS 102226 TaxID=1442371 RepID=A0A0D2JS24_9EURO|nr:uncharacterized protein Z520_11094 [Fonsecaea multimorphosa CBS 102226]KIX93239.1 hypothetical protein Z520_11094 [Fonsecaea multimorphosa CBS 102226]
MPETRRILAQGNVRFMKSAFVKQALGEQVLWTEEDRSVVVRDGHSVTIRIYRPKPSHPHRSGASARRQPVMVYAHSGGWCMGGLDTEEFLCQLLAVRLGIIVVSVDYRLAPEWSYPTCVYDVYDVIKWVSVNAETIGGDLSRGFLTGGASGGGNLTCMATIMARDDKLQPSLSGHLLICTGMPHDFTDRKGHNVVLFPEKLSRGSWERYKNGPVATREMNILYGRKHAKSHAFSNSRLTKDIEISNFDAHSPNVTPLTQTDFSKLGPVFYQVAEMDIWRDSAVFYCDKIKEAGGQVKVEIYPGVPHLWWSMYPQLSINKKWVHDLVNGVEWLLSQKTRDAAPLSSRL